MYNESCNMNVRIIILQQYKLRTAWGEGSVDNIYVMHITERCEKKVNLVSRGTSA